MKTILTNSISNIRKTILDNASHIALNIVTIVFSVYLAQYIDRQREYERKQNDVRDFLIGLKTDLKNDIKEMQEDKKAYLWNKLGFTRLISTQPPPEDSLYRYMNVVYSRIGLVANSGRYEGFKASGKIMDIEDKELANNILDLYQERIPMLLSSTNHYNKHKDMLSDYVNATRISLHGKDNLREVINTPLFYNLANQLQYTGEIQQRYDMGIALCQKIIDTINAKYATTN